MNVTELIDVLQRQDGDRLVVLSRDSEGNGFSPLDDIGEAFYEAETPRTGELIEVEEGEETEAQPALVLWPSV